LPVLAPAQQLVIDLAQLVQALLDLGISGQAVWTEPRAKKVPGKSGSGVPPLCYLKEEAGRLFHFYWTVLAPVAANYLSGFHSVLF
jgi:hypothetical protein